ncbi:MAG: hypothetical protein IPH81_20355 [Candidatus Microthrix sp.]|nr:hypothetical protein [Candidatus Microthrix sp.]
MRPRSPGVDGVPARVSPTGGSAAGGLRQRSSLDLSGIDYYIAFGCWKLACIIAGVCARYAAVPRATPAGRAEGFRTMIEGIERLAYQSLESSSLEASS